MNTIEVGNRLVELVKAGSIPTVWEELYSDEIVSVEPYGGEMAVSTGKAALPAKDEWFSSTFETHGIDVLGPFPHGDEFAVYYSFDVTHRESGHRFPMNEVAVYKVADGKIVHERFFYMPMDM